MPKNAAKLVVWRGFWVKLRAQRRSKIAAHELISVALDLFGGLGDNEVSTAQTCCLVDAPASSGAAK